MRTTEMPKFVGHEEDDLKTKTVCPDPNMDSALAVLAESPASPLGESPKGPSHCPVTVSAVSVAEVPEPATGDDFIDRNVKIRGHAGLDGAVSHNGGFAHHAP
jgi:hypothetical protein